MNIQKKQLRTAARDRLVRSGVSAVLAVILLAGTVIPAAATPFTSSDGVIAINLPSGNWSEIEDPDHWITLSDGSSLITIQHFANGDKLPEIPAADPQYVRTLSASVSTQNEVFAAFGYVADIDVAYDIYEALASFRILQYDTKTAVTDTGNDAETDIGTDTSTNKITASDFSILPTDMTLYVNVSEDDGGVLNVRKGFSSKSDLIGKLASGTVVQVTGIVQLKGADYGWYKIAYENGYGYVSADYLSDTEPAAPAYAEEVDTEYTDTAESYSENWEEWG